MGGGGGGGGVAAGCRRAYLQAHRPEGEMYLNARGYFPSSWRAGPQSTEGREGGLLLAVEDVWQEGPQTH